MKKHLPDGEQAVEHDTQEHQQLVEIMKKLEGLDSAEAEFLETFGQLDAVLRDHVHDEEHDQFPELRAKIPHDDLVSMGKKVELAKKAAPTRPHPAAPHSALFHLTVGPGVGFVDRLRDALTNRSNSA
jgi:hypothetical protein